MTSTVDNTGNVNCQSFDTQIGPNTYKNSQNMYWFFNPNYQFWVCVNATKYDYDSCRASFNARTAKGYEDLSGGNSLDIEYAIPMVNTYEVTCTGSSIPAPTFGSGSGGGTTSDGNPSPTAAPNGKVFITISMYSIMSFIVIMLI